MLRRIALSFVLIVGLAGAVLLPSAFASASSDDSRSATHIAPDYRNPLRLALPEGAQAASCADPSVLHARTHGDRHWYLYCTSDALRADELGADGKPLIHNVPMYSSLDLVHWRYVGDAFPTKPSWVSATGGVWAPDVEYYAGRYLMYFTASDTTFAGGGSAIGVATSSTPTGPWTAQDVPVVSPTDSPSTPGQRRWEYDPEIVHDLGRTYLYFGSYFGGIFVRQLSADGRSSIATSEKQIAIDNRYEGTYIVRHNGWFYFFGSATNCCNGPLTGYAVFTARSRSPLGPFRDRDGRTIVSSRVGGTPVLTQNGNRWVGTGHNAVVTDYSGQQWIVYHAVDRADPYYAGDVGYTKRPALLDPLDWQHNWPVVRGGSGPSERYQPGPAAQPGERTAYRPRFLAPVRGGATIARLSDDFGGTRLSPQWTWVRPPDATTYSVSAGQLRWQTQNADLHPGDPTAPVLASVLTEPAPSGDYAVTAKVHTTVPASGCCQNFVQGGVVIYRGDADYVKLASVSIYDTRQTEFGKQVSGQPTGYPTYGNTVVGPVGYWTYLRIVHRGPRYTAYTSLDGRRWDHGGTWTAALGTAPRIGLIAMGGTGFRADFASVHVARIR